MDLFGQNVAVYNVVAAVYMHHRVQSDMAFYKRVSAMTRTGERRVFYEHLHAMKSQYYHWYAAEFNVLADNFVANQLIWMQIGLSNIWKQGGSSFLRRKPEIFDSEYAECSGNR